MEDNRETPSVSTNISPSVKKLLEDNITLSEESKKLFTVIDERITKGNRWVIFFNAFFVILTIGLILYFLNTRPAAVRRATEELKEEINRNRVIKDSIGFLIQVNRRLRDSIAVERARNEAKVSELQRIQEVLK